MYLSESVNVDAFADSFFLRLVFYHRHSFFRINANQQLNNSKLPIGILGKSKKVN